MAKKIKIAKSTKVNSKKKSVSRSLNAFDLATRQVRAANGGDSDDDSDDGAIVNPLRKGNDEDGSDQEIEDEEIDSDEALGEDDDYDVLNSKFSQSIRDKKKRQKNGEVDEDEEDEAYDSIDESELLPLSAVWDLDDKDIKSSKGAKDIVLDDSESESELESDSEDDDEEESDDYDQSDEEEFPFDDEDVSDDEEIELTNLKNHLKKSEKKVAKKYQNLQIEENELALPGGGQEISLADMLSVVESNASNKAILIDKEDEEANKALAVPLPKRIQQRHERKAAYEITKDEVNKWKDTVKANRNAEVLSFPLNPTVQHNAVSTFTETFALTDLEKKVNSVLSESALLDEKQEAKFEQIATAKMSPEELRKRQNELRKMRELMFRQEREAKRLKKIKSKSFRRIKKKEMLRNKALVEGEEESDEEDHDSRRAQERMSLKHKNNSKWAQSMIKSGMSKDSEAREEMEEMLRRGERLRSKILDRDGSDDEFGDSNDMNLDKEDDHNSDEEQEIKQNLGKTGVLNMAFMKNAEARERTSNKDTLNELRGLNGDDDLKAFEEKQENNKFNVEINSGRRIYTPGALKANDAMTEVNKEVVEEYEVDKSKDLKNRLSKKHNKGSLLSRQGESTQKEAQEEEEESNPWLTNDDNNVQRSKKIKVVDASSSKLEKSNAKMNKQKKRTASEVNNNDDDEIIDMNQSLKIIDPHGEGENDSDEEGGVHMFKQKDLIKQAFAGDDVVTEFKQEKKKMIKEQGDQVEDLTLPGWGDWAGGSSKKKQKKNKIVKVTKGVEFNKRKDKNLKNVIINEKTNKRNVKYQSSAVPFPFENREQYERSLRMPIGQEWTSRETHQRLTMPKVIAKSGVVIDPLKAPFK